MNLVRKLSSWYFQFKTLVNFLGNKFYREHQQLQSFQTIPAMLRRDFLLELLPFGIFLEHSDFKLWQIQIQKEYLVDLIQLCESCLYFFSYFHQLKN